MSPFAVLPVVAGVLWLGHAGLSIANGAASRYTRWIVFAGLPILAVVMLLSGGMAGFLFALITALTWLGMILLEVSLTIGLMVARGVRARRAT
ncbi:hypothetical protein [Pseudarthrobacter siccitolerans]